ncbi:MAG TPA: hypothetical protein VF755_26555 [Catenuloplanes sp.]|jgi:hypothetical protein
MVSEERSRPGARSGPADPARDGRTVGDRAVYQRPTIRRLGTLTDLTRGGVSGIDDGVGGAGDDGSL